MTRTSLVDIGEWVGALICDFVTGATGGMIDLTGYFPPTQTPERKAIDMTPRPFTAWAMCPKCERIDCHQMRLPKPAPSAVEMQRWEEQRLFVDIETWGSSVISKKEVGPPPPVDESKYEVIRMCKCGYEFGQV